jgi:hypothetical protein
MHHGNESVTLRGKFSPFPKPSEGEGDALSFPLTGRPHGIELHGHMAQAI